MKRIFTSLALASAALAANAQVARVDLGAPKSLADANVQRTAVTAGKLSAEKFSVASVSNFKAPMRAEEVSPLNVIYKQPDCAWFAGIDPSAGWYKVPFVYTPGRKEITWLNYSKSEDKETPITYAWADDENSIEYTVTPEGDGVGSVWGSVMTPNLTATQGDFTGTYNIGQANDYGYGIWVGGTESWERLGQAQFGTGNGVYDGFYARDLYTNTKGVDYDLDENNNRIEGSATPIFNSEIVGFAQRFPAMTDFVSAKAATLTLCVDDNADPAPLHGQTLTCTVFEITEDGSLGEILMEATATDENCIPLSNWLYSFEFNFVENDPLFGEIESPIYLEGKEFMVCFTGFENVDTPFQAPFCGNDGFAAGGYMIFADGSFNAITYSNVAIPRLDYLISITAAIPVLEASPSMIGYVHIPAEGGWGVTTIDEETGQAYNDFDVLTLTKDIDEFYLYSDDDNDWLNFDYDDQYAERGYMLFYFGTDEPLPEGETTRSCVVSIDLFGKTIDVPVYQGEVPEDVLSIEAAKNNAKKNGQAYNLAGQRVNSNFRGIVIKDGKKAIVK